MTEIDQQQRQLQGLALLLQLQRKARHSEDTAALAFSMVNETRSLLAYRQAALWIAPPHSHIVAVSGIALIEAHAPYTVWLRRLAEWLHQQAGSSTAYQLTANDTPDETAQAWSEWCAPYGLWLPLQEGDGRIFGGLLLWREQPWQDAEITLLAELGDAYAHAWRTLQPAPAWWRRKLKGPKPRWLWLLPLILLLPVRQSVLAPAEIAAIDPTLIRAPLDGVVAEFHVRPNQTVTQGQLLLSLENTDIANRLAISRKALAVAETDFRSHAQQAVLDGKSKAELNVLKGKIEQYAAEVAYMEDQLARSQIKAPHAGLAIFTDAQDWLGKPVAVGERIMQIADPRQVELHMHLPVADLINFADQAETVMFLNSNPQNPLSGNLYYASYQAEVTLDNVLAYRLKAHLQPGDIQPRIGLKGTAKLYGHRVTLFYYLFRRPLAGLRQWLGL
jgi:hypothetical protein